MGNIFNILLLTFINSWFIFAQGQNTTNQKPHWQPIPDSFTGNSADWARELRKELDPVFEPSSALTYAIRVGEKGSYDLVYFIQDVDHTNNEVAPWLVAYDEHAEDNTIENRVYVINEKLDFWYNDISLYGASNSAYDIRSDERFPLELRNSFDNFQWNTKLKIWGIELLIVPPGL